MRCANCNHSGGNMRRCKACGRVFCQTCEGTGSNRCPFCSTIGKVDLLSRLNRLSEGKCGEWDVYIRCKEILKLYRMRWQIELAFRAF